MVKRWQDQGRLIEKKNYSLLYYIHAYIYIYIYIYHGNGHDLVSKKKQILILGHCVQDCIGKSLALFRSLDVFWHN